MSLDVSKQRPKPDGDPPVQRRYRRNVSSMDAADGDRDIETQSVRRSPWGWIKYSIRMLFNGVTAPVRAYFSLRRSMTVASVAALLGAFTTLNVIWGFPWSGMMGACMAILLVGFTINRFMRPSLKLSVSLPRSAVAGNPFSVNVRLTNSRYLPALGLRVGFHREGLRDVYSRRGDLDWESSPPVSVELLRSGDQMQWHGSMRIQTRGIHELPPFQVSSTFPFHLFHYRKSIDAETKIAITPAPATTDDDSATRVMLSRIGEWAKQLVAGAPVEYVGNREYQEGVAVRRWDFASWARLGRPIVREYQSPSIHAVTLIVDLSSTVSDEPASRSLMKQAQRDQAERLEHLLSVAASAISDITHRRVQLSLVLTCEPPSENPRSANASSVGESNERMFVRLAGATAVDAKLGEQRIRETLDVAHAQPTLILSLIDLDDERRRDLAKDLPPQVTYLPIGFADESQDAPSPGRALRQDAAHATEHSQHPADEVQSGKAHRNTADRNTVDKNTSQKSTAQTSTAERTRA